MHGKLSLLSYKQKSQLAELLFLLFVGVLSPLAVGLQIFSKFSFTLSLVFINLLGLPAIIVFYRLYLPFVIEKKKYLLGALLFPFYILLYELNTRLSAIITIAMPFIPVGYRNNLVSGHPADFTRGYFNETIGYTCLVLLSVTSLFVAKLLFRNQQDLNTLETEKLKIELNHLKSQVQPHFFFNTLNNMYSLSVQNSPKTPLMITDLSAIMRYMLYDTQNEKVPLKQEVDFIDSYISLENLRHSQTGIIDFAIQGDVSKIEIEPLLFLPLIENTFKHALHQDLPQKWVKLILAVTDDELVFQTSNPKGHRVAVRDKSQSGLGLANVNKRLNLLYPNRHELIIHEEDDIFTVTLTIRIK